MKSTEIRDFILSTKYDPDMSFTMVLMEKNKSGKLGSQEIGEGIASIPLDKFLDYFNCAQKDAV